MSRETAEVSLRHGSILTKDLGFFEHVLFHVAVEVRINVETRHRIVDCTDKRKRNASPVKSSKERELRPNVTGRCDEVAVQAD
ncbi:MAG: hypothetical protein M1812_003439, partial [Candelaria pacifica]